MASLRNSSTPSPVESIIVPFLGFFFLPVSGFERHGIFLSIFLLDLCLLFLFTDPLSRRGARLSILPPVGDAQPAFPILPANWFPFLVFYSFKDPGPVLDSYQKAVPPPPSRIARRPVKDRFFPALGPVALPIFSRAGPHRISVA